MKVLVVGAGGREHAIAWRLARDPQVKQVWVAPGNAGTRSGKIEPVPATRMVQLRDAAASLGADLTVVGPEAPLVEGIADAFAERGLALLGPVAEAARVEGSKVHAKRLMTSLGIPTPAYSVILSIAQLQEHVSSNQPPYVIKADGLAAGKGVVIATDADEAVTIGREFLAGRHGDASRTIVVEQHCEGTEATLMLLCDGVAAVPLPLCQDYKRLGDGGSGPNTGGMGACCPPPGDLRLDVDDVIETAVLPLLGQLAMQGSPYRGFLYVGLMVEPAGGFKVLEYNCRLGDPEAQAVLPLWDDEFAEALAAAARGRLQASSLSWSTKACVAVVLASAGYPGKPETGQPLQLPEHGLQEMIFHAGTRVADDGTLETSAGRVCSAVSWRDESAAARECAYELASRIHFAGMVKRADIGLG